MKRIEANGVGSDTADVEHRDTAVLVPMSEQLKHDLTERAKARGFSVSAVLRALARAWAGRPPDIPGEDFVSAEDIAREMEPAPPRTKPTGRPKGSGAKTKPASKRKR
jgi:hypothetical protein